jgi:hypothetical protein
VKRKKVPFSTTPNQKIFPSPFLDENNVITPKEDLLKSDLTQNRQNGTEISSRNPKMQYKIQLRSSPKHKKSHLSHIQSH